MKKVKVAILGYGRSGSTLHADPIEKLKEFEMIAVCDIDKKAREKAVKRFGCTVYSDYHKMLKSEQLDLVVIVTRSDQHSRMVCDCLKAGHNVLITKPWCRSEREAQKMIAAAKQSKKLLLPWLPARWGTDFIKLKELISSKVIGKVFQITRREHAFTFRNDWQTKSKFGGGLLLNWGPHLIDPPLLLAGGKVKSVFGKLQQTINPGDVEDCFLSIITMDNGVVVISENSIMDIDSYPNWTIQGAKGTITVYETKIEIHKMTKAKKKETNSYRNGFNRKIIKVNASGSNRITQSNRYGDAKIIYPAIAQAIFKKNKYPASPESALYLTKILDTVKLSAKKNEVINF